MQLISAKRDLITKSSATYVIYFRRLSHFPKVLQLSLASKKILKALKEMNQNILKNSFSAETVR